MLGFLTSDERGASDKLLSRVAQRLIDEGTRLTGVVQENVEQDTGIRCDMMVRVLPGDARICISQSLGPGSTGCRLDPEGLEQAAGLVETSLAAPAQLLIINKFGKQEIDGRGFRPLIGKALSEDIPVLISVGQSHREGFLDFAEGMAEEIPADEQAVLDWCRTNVAEHARP